MLDELIEKIKSEKNEWEKFKTFFTESTIPAKTILLNEGEKSTHIYFVKKGCLRLWFNKDGKDITFQFFLEGQGVASIDSFLSGQPSIFNLEAIEPSTVVSISKEKFDELQIKFPEIKAGLQDILLRRMRNYSLLFLSRIKDTPAERYKELLKDHPEIIKRIPQHYIASYLGITPISLSRIRNRK